MKSGFLVTLLSTFAFLQILNPKQIVTDAIMGGVPIGQAEIKSLVFLASVYEEREFPSDSRVRVCGGTLIHPQWVLTAAHCFYDKAGNLIAPQDWVASFGVSEIGTSIQGLYVDITNFVNNNSPWLPVQRRIRNIFIYPKYNKFDYTSHDIALLFLDRAVSLGVYIDIMPVPKTIRELTVPINTRCVSAGWGCQIVGGDPNLLAARGSFVIMPDSSCSNLQGTMTSKKICVGNTSASNSICKGDSGGPLLCYQGGPYVLTGVASYSSKANRIANPNVFTRVAPYVKWLHGLMNGHAMIYQT